MRSWGGLPARSQNEIQLAWPDELLRLWQQELLPVGCGRSYGDSGLAASGTVLNMQRVNRIIDFNTETGVIRCEAGTTLGQIMRLGVPRGWSVPVLPGTQFVTVAGAVANDIHGKNHHRAGTLGAHVTQLGLQRSDGKHIVCSSQQHSEWFSATVGGLGLTGVILWVELQLRPVPGPWLDSETIKFETLDEFFVLSEASESDYEYTVAWIDCLSARTRGHFTRANHSAVSRTVAPAKRLPAIPFELPCSPVNHFTLKAFNSIYYARQRAKSVSRSLPWSRWFFPLDALGNWNRLYGKQGFRQYQCVVPPEYVGALLNIIRQSGEGSALAVLKVFGGRQSPGLLSFPRPGATLAVDFPWRGNSTLALFRRLDALVFGGGGTVYPAKDAHMAGADFRAAYPAWQQLEQMRDAKINSLFWQRVTETG